MISNGGYASAITTMKDHMEEHPDDASFCRRYINEWQKDMPQTDAWKALVRRLDKLAVAKTKEGYIRSYKALKEFKSRNPDEAFRAKRPMDDAVKRYNSLTNQFLNDEVADAFDEDSDGGWNENDADTWEQDNRKPKKNDDDTDASNAGGEGGDDWWND